MKIATRTLLLTTLAATSIFFTACDDKEQAAPIPADPTPVFALSRSFYFPGTQTNLDAVYPAAAIAGESSAYPLVVALDFKTSADNIHLELDRAALGSNWLGSYALQGPGQMSNPVFVSYNYSNNGGVRIFRFSNTTPNLTGRVTITAFDAKRKLVSGKYELTAPSQSDPTQVRPDNLCDITLKGEFTDVKVKGN